MARKLNKNLVGVLVLVGMLVMTVAGVVLVQNLPQQDPSKYAEEARVLREEGEYESALRTYVRAYMKDPAQDAEYLVKAAECALDLGDVGKTRQLVDQAKVRNPRLQSALRLGLSLEFDVTELNSSTAQWNRVRQLAEEMLSIDENEESALAHHALGAAYLALAESDSSYEEKGEAHLRRAHELAPTDVEIVRALGDLLWRRATRRDAEGDVEQADALRGERDALVASALERCRGLGKTEAVADLERVQANQMIRDAAYFEKARGWTGRARSMREEGLRRLATLAEQETTRAACHRILGTLYSGQSGIEQDLDKAEGYLKKALEIDPKDGETYLALGRVYRLQRAALPRDSEGWEEKLAAERALYEQGLEAIDRSEHFRKFRNRRARVAFIRELFLQGLNRARSAGSEDERAAGLAEGARRLEQMKEEINPESFQVKFLTAHLLYAQGDLKSATREAEAARRMMVTGVNSDLIRLLTELYMKQGQWGAALDSLSAVIELPSQRNDPVLHMELARVYLKLNRPADALAHLKPGEPASLREALDANESATRLRIEAYRQLNQFELAEAEIRRLGDGTPERDLFMATALMWESRYDEAEAKLRSVLEAEPDNEQAIQALLQVLQKTDREAEARAFLDERLASDPDNRVLKRYRLLLSSEPAGEARDEQILSFINEEQDPFRRYVSLMGFYESRDQIDKAREYLEKAAAIRPDDPNIVEQQLRLALVAEDWDRAEAYARRHGELNVDGTEGKLAEGRLALARGLAAKAADRPEEASALFDQAIDLMRLGLQRYPNYSLGWTYLAGACMEANRVGEAKRELDRALEVDPTNAHASKFLARIAMLEGDENAERRHLVRAARSLQNDPLIRDRLQYYQEKDNPREGVATREKIRAKEPENLKNLVLLARLYADERVGEHEKAEEAYRAALALSRQDLALAREVASFYASEAVGRPMEGEKLLSEMLQQEEDAARKALISCALGEFFESRDQVQTADRYYRQAVFLDPSVKILALAAQFFSRTGRYTQALEHHERILELAREDPEVRRETESRMIAILLSIREMDRAKKMIDAYVARYPEDEDGMIYEGAYHRLGGDIEKAKAAFDAHLDRNPDNPLALWQRGMLHRLRGRWERAIEDFRKAKAFHPNGFGYQHRIALANTLIEAGRVDAGISELQQVIEHDPDNRGAMESLLEAYTQLGPSRVAKGEDLAYKYMRLYPYDEKWPVFLGKLAELSGDWDKAIRGYEKAAELGRYREETVVSLFQAYRRANRPGEIVRYASEKFSERLLDKMPDALALVAWAYGQGGQREKAFAMFERALAASSRRFEPFTRVMFEMVGALGREAAMREVRARVSADESNVDMQMALVHLLQGAGQTEEAVAVCDRLLSVATRQADRVFAHLAKGMLLKALGRKEAAKQEYEAVLKLDSDQTLALNNLAYLLGEEMNNPAEALPYAERASRLQADNANVLDTYGWILVLNHRLGEGAGMLLRALELDRRNIDVLYHLGRLYQMRGETEEARLRLTQAKEIAEAPQGRKDYLPKISEALKELEAPRGS